jgi:hypothetical protein
MSESNMRRYFVSACLALSLLICHCVSKPAYAKPTFTSVYTDLSKDCKAAFDEKDIQEGQDMPLICRGFGGYQLTIGFSAMNSHLNVEHVSTKKNRQGSVLKADLSIEFEKGKIEWRLADGKPFAIIARTMMRTDINVVEPRTLAVKGLTGYEHINGDVSAKLKDANAKARDIADNGYLKVVP